MFEIYSEETGGKVIETKDEMLFVLMECYSGTNEKSIRVYDKVKNKEHLFSQDIDTIEDIMDVFFPPLNKGKN